MARILASDDEDCFLYIIKSAIEKEGHEIKAFSNPLTIPKQNFCHYDLILLDVMMPEIDGFTLCKEIRDLVDSSIVFRTAKTMDKDLITGLSLGVDDLSLINLWHCIRSSGCTSLCYHVLT